MSAAQRREPAPLIARLLEEPHRYGFFQALRLLERWLRRSERSGAAPVLGRRIGIRSSLSLSFPASEIAALEVVRREADGDAPATDAHGTPDPRSIERIVLTPAFIGLLGAGGALPSYYTELFAERETYHRDRAGRAFLDIFLHRATALFYDAWQKHRLPVQYEADRRNRYLPLVLAVAGLHPAALRDRLQPRDGGVADDALAFHAGALQRRPVSAATVQRLLQHYFGIAVKLEQFVGRWFALPHDNQSHLGLANMQLGRDAVVGERIWQRDLRMRLTFGPMPRAKFARLLPGGPGAKALAELLGLLTGAMFEYEVRLVLRAEDVRGTALDAAGGRLGHDSFLVTAPVAQDRDDVAYELLALA